MKRPFVIATAALASLVLGVFLAGAETRPAELTADAVNPRAVVLEVDRPAGTDDGVWQRTIATYAAKIRLSRSMEALQEALQADKGVVRPGLVDSPEALAAAVHVRQIPGTALLEVWADVSAQPQISAQKTHKLVAAFMDQQRDEAQAVLAQRIEDTKRAATHLQQTIAVERAQMDDYRSTHALDTPSPATAPVDAQHAASLRELKEREGRLDGPRAQLDDLQRRLIELELTSPTVPIHIVQDTK